MNPEQAKALREKFPKEAVSKLDRGNNVILDYVGHAATTARLIEVDPMWTWEPLALTPEGLPLFDSIGGLWIKLTVCGHTRLGYGDTGGKKGANAVKEAIGDAIRNAAMRFGVALDLWSKEEIGTTFETPKPVATDKDVTRWEQAIAKANTFIDLKRVADEITAHHVDDATRAELLALWQARNTDLAGAPNAL